MLGHNNNGRATRSMSSHTRRACSCWRRWRHHGMACTTSVCHRRWSWSSSLSATRWSTRHLGMVMARMSRRTHGRFGFRHRPHMHRYRPIWLNHCLPHLRKNNFAIWPDQIVMAFSNVLSEHVNMQESLLNQLLHTLIVLAIEFGEKPGYVRPM